jgi:hypothetical protein
MRTAIVTAFGLLGLAVAGCAGTKPAAPPRVGPTTIPTRNTDPCAMRLHEAAGALLLYYATHHDLPPNLDALEKAPGAEEAGDFTCPISHKPYIYDPKGVAAPNPSERLVLYDAEPSHDGRRWAIAVIPPQGEGPLIAKVIAVPESHFVRLAIPPASTR